MARKPHDPYVVSDATCKGCSHYRYLAGFYMKACHYTLDTGKFKPLDMKCADCTYKTTMKLKLKEHSWRGRPKKKGKKKCHSKT